MNSAENIYNQIKSYDTMEIKSKKEPLKTRNQTNQTKIKIKPLHPILVINTDIEIQAKLTLEE
jgi:hypothetical protein